MRDRETNAFIQGYAAACADLARGGEDGHARELLHNVELTAADLAAHGVEASDLEPLLEALK